MRTKTRIASAVLADLQPHRIDRMPSYLSTGVHKDLEDHPSVC